MKNLAFVLFILLPSSIAYSATDLLSPKLDASIRQNRDWTITHPSPDRVLLVNQKINQAVLIREYRSKVSLHDSEAYLKSEYVRKIVPSRTKQLKFKEAHIKNPAAMAGVYRGRQFGQFSFVFEIAEGNASFTERLWPAEGRLWQATIADYGGSVSSSQEDKLSEMMSAIMDATSHKSASWLQFILPDANAAELINGSETSPSNNGFSVPIDNKGAAACDALHLDAKIRGPGGPSIKINSSFVSNCIEGAGDTFPKMLDSTKKAFAAGLEDLTAKTEANLERHPCKEPKHPSGIGGWLVYSSEIEAYNTCLETASTTAVIQKTGDIIAGTASGVSSLAQWVWTTKDRVAVIAAIIENKIDGFACTNAETQAKMFCEFVTKASAATVATIATSGVSAAGAAALSGAKGAVVLAEGLRAAKAALVAPLKLVKGAEKKEATDATAAHSWKDFDSGQEYAQSAQNDIRYSEIQRQGEIDRQRILEYNARAAAEPVPEQPAAPAGILKAPTAKEVHDPYMADVYKRMAERKERERLALEAADKAQAERISKRVGADDPALAEALTQHPRLSASQLMYSPLKTISGRSKTEVESKLQKLAFKSSTSASSGVNGARIVTLEDGSKAVWKPHAETWSSNYRAEVLAYELDQKFGFGLVPPTVDRVVDGKIGSVQLFKASRKNLTPESSEIRKQKLLDFVLDNRDRHGGNFLTDPSGKIISIDNGLSFTGKGNNGTTFFTKRDDLNVFLKTDEGKQIVSKIRASVSEPNFGTEVHDYLGKTDADRLVKRLKFIVDYSDKLGN